MLAENKVLDDHLPFLNSTVVDTALDPGPMITPCEASSIEKSSSIVPDIQKQQDLLVLINLLYFILIVLRR